MQIAFAKTWASYIDGQIVSQHARQRIQNFLSNVSGRDAGDESGQEEGDRSDVDEDIPHLEVKPDELQQILASKNLFVPAEKEEGAGGGQSEKTKGKPFRAEYARGGSAIRNAVVDASEGGGWAYCYTRRNVWRKITGIREGT